MWCIKRFRFWASTLEIWDFLRKWISRLLYGALDQLMADDYEVEERMMLEGRVYRGRRADRKGYCSE